MKKTLLIAAAMLSFGYANAQMKLGNNPTTTNANAVLEMETTNKGLLLPRVALTSTTAFAPLTAHIAGMAVYNTATAGDVTPGYYFDNGTKWVRVADANAVVNTLYTADGTLAGTGARTITMGSTGNNLLNFTGTSGTVSIGTQYSAGLTLTGSGTNRADISLTAGASSVFLYVDNNDVAQLVAAGNSLVLGTSDASPMQFGTNNRSTDMTLSGAGNLGIGTTTPSQKLDVAGTTKTNALQVVTGAGAGKVLTSDAAGNATWQTPTTTLELSSVAFLSLSASDGGVTPNIVWNQTLVNGSPTNIAPNGATGVITLTQGTYMILINLMTFGHAAGAYASVGLFDEGTNAEVYAGKYCFAVNINTVNQASSNYTWTIVVPAGGGSYSLRRTGGTNCRFETASSLGITKLN